MISKDRYEILKARYGDVSSWAIWKEPGQSPRSNTGDMSVFDHPDLLEVLNPNIVFVGLNASSTHGSRRDGRWYPWMNFHSDYARQNDYKLRYALMGTPLWGAYITDVIKRYPEVDSSKVRKMLSNEPDFVRKNVNDLLEEIHILTPDLPVLAALGEYTYSILKKNLPDYYKIIPLWHYSAMIGKEDYRALVLRRFEENGI